MIPFALIAVGVFACDYLTKALVRSRLPLGAEVPIASFFSVVHVQNTGIAFGLFPGRNVLFILIGCAMTAALIYLARRAQLTSPWTSVIFAVILGGAWGNLVDRIVFGRVTDFLDFYWGIHHWPAFNVADSAICVGATFLLLQNFFAPDHRH